MLYKKCRVCGEMKEVTEFHKKKGSPDGVRNECKECVKELQKKYKEAPGFKEKRADYDKNRYSNEREQILERKKDYYNENKEVILSYKKNYRKQNEDKIKDYLADYRINNREKLRNYIKNNPDVNSKHQARYRERYPHIVAWRSVLYSTLERLGTIKEGHTIDMLGYSALELKENMEKKFKPGMSWSNHGEWHIDHIRPVTKFDPSTPIEVVCALENLQPLWWQENISKGNKI